MQTDYTSPECPVPDFPGLESPAEGGTPQLDTEETSEHPQTTHSYRAFLISGMLKQVAAARQIVAVVGTGNPENRLKAFDNCRTNAWFVRHRTTGKVRVASQRCHQRWCPLCIRTKRFVITQNVAKWMDPVVQPKFLTLTLKHSNAELADQIDALYGFWKELRRRPWFKKRVFGGVWFFQVKVSATDGLWHPHLHILFQGRFLNHAELSELWKSITHGSSIVDVRAVKNRKKAVEYVARYAAAPADLSELPYHKAVELASALHNRRICGAFGLAKGIKFVSSPPADAADWQRLGGYETILYGANWNFVDDEIVRAWKTDTPCAYIPPEPPPWDPIEETVTPDDVMSYNQLLLDFYERTVK